MYSRLDRYKYDVPITTIRVTKRTREDILKMAYLENCLNSDLDKFGPRSVLIEVEDEEFLADKVLLSAQSEYFRTMFNGPYLERNTERLSISMVRKEDFKLFLQYVQDETLSWSQVDSDNVLRVLESATMLRLRSFIIACEERLIGDWECFGNASEIYCMARTYQMDRLRHHMLNLLAKCMDIGCHVWLNEIFYQSELDECVYSVEVSYEYLLDGLTENNSDGVVRLGPPKKEYFKGSRDVAESKALLEWVLIWVSNYLFDSEFDGTLSVEDVDSLLALCDMEYLMTDEIDDALDVCIRMTCEEHRTAISTFLTEAVSRGKNRVKLKLEDMKVNFILTGTNCFKDATDDRRHPTDFTSCVWCRPVVEEKKASYYFQEVILPFKMNVFVLVGYTRETETLCLYRPNYKNFWSFNMPTGDIKCVGDFQRDITMVASTLQGDSIFCLCYQRDMWLDGYQHIPQSPVLATYNIESGQWEYTVTNIEDSNYHSNSNLVYSNGFLYFVEIGKDHEKVVKLFLYRFRVDSQELERNEHIQWDLGLERLHMKIVLHRDNVVVFSSNTIYVVDPANFASKDRGITSMTMERNDWKILDAVSRNDELLLITCRSELSSQMCICGLHLSTVDLVERTIVGLGFVDNVFSNHRCRRISKWARSNFLVLS